MEPLEETLVPAGIGVASVLVADAVKRSLLHGKSDFAKAGQKKNAANCDGSN